MPRFDQACTACAWAAEVFTQPFVNPPCPLCGAPTERTWVMSATVRGDAIPGGQLIENLGHAPVVVYSRSELTRIARERGLEQMVRHVPIPGTDKSPHTTSWAASSPWMLEQARLLLERVGAQGPTAPAAPSPQPGDIPRDAVARVYAELNSR